MKKVNSPSSKTMFYIYKGGEFIGSIVFGSKRGRGLPFKRGMIPSIDPDARFANCLYL